MKKNLFRGLTGLTAGLLVLSVGATQICSARTTFLNSRLGTSNFKLVDNGDGSEDGTYFDSEFTSLTDLVSAEQELAEEIAGEGSVLFKNENSVLPLDTSKTVTLWGLNSIWPTLGGMIGSSTDTAEDQDSYDLVAALGAKGFDVNGAMLGLYYGDTAQPYWRWSGFHQPNHSLEPSFTAAHEESTYYSVGEAPTSIYTDDVLASCDNTTAIVTISRDSSEAAEYSDSMVGNASLENPDTGDALENGPLSLSNYEKDMIELAKQHSTGVVVLINSDSAMEIQELKDDPDIDAILWVGEPGVYGFLGVADVLSGAVNPSGHISDTYAVDYSASPAMVNFGLYEYSNATDSSNPVLTEANKADWYVVESEGIYVGYKYYETRYEDQVLGQGNADCTDGSSTGSAWDYASEVTYPFGYGLSYTTFSQTLDSVEVSVGEIGKATVTVTNTGDVAGKSVAELYVQAPYTAGGLEKASVQLVGYAKTSELAPGASETVEIEIDPTYFASYDETAANADGTNGAWVLESGDYYFSIGNGSHEALNAILAAKTGDTSNLEAITEGDEFNAANAYKWTLGETDTTTYSENVSNELQDMDLNNYIDGAVEYTTRSDWSKGWTEITSIDPTDEMMVGLTNSSYELTENSDEEVVWGVSSGMTMMDMIETDEDGNYAGVVDLDDPSWDTLIQQMSLDEAIQFIEYAGDDFENIDSIMFPRTYSNDGPLGFTYDQVGGYSTRWTTSNSSEPTYVSTNDEDADYSMNVMPTEPVVAATFNDELVEREGEILGEEALWSNETYIIAPGVNLHRTPYNGRNHEYYSEDSQLTNLLAMALCTGAKNKGLGAQAKHLAFNHQELNRSGISTFMTEQAARENELRCFQGIMSTNTTLSVMTAFNRAGTTYVGAHEGLLVGIVRNEWGFTGGLVTDMINGADYMNWRDVVLGGGGTCLTSSAYADCEMGTMEASKDAIEKDSKFQAEMQKAIKYWMYSAAQTNAFNGFTSTTEIVAVSPWYMTLCHALEGVFGVLTVLFLALYAMPDKKKKA